MLHKYDPKSIWYLDRTRMRGNSIFDRLTSLFFRIRSTVETREGGVIYRRRIFRCFGLRKVCFIDYYFHSIDDIDDDIDPMLLHTGQDKCCISSCRRTNYSSRKENKTCLSSKILY